jgi:hypothetical protein
LLLLLMQHAHGALKREGGRPRARSGGGGGGSRQQGEALHAASRCSPLFPLFPASFVPSTTF